MSGTTTGFPLARILEATGGRLVNGDQLGPNAGVGITVDRPSVLGGSGPRDLAFFFSREYESELPRANPGILLTGEDFVKPMAEAGLPFWSRTAVVACRDPYFAMAVLSELFAPISSVAHIPPKPGAAAALDGACVHSSAVVDPSAELGPGVRIGAFVVIEKGVRVGAGSVIYPHCFLGEKVTLGRDCVLFPKVTIYEWAELGDRVRVHAGTVIGADGFGYAPRKADGKPVGHQKIYHLGKVVIGADVEIGANTCVDRATFGETRLGAQVKLDNLVQVGHNVRIDDGAVVCGGTGLAGNSKIGKFALVLGNVGVVNQIVVGDGATVAAHTCVSKDVPAGGTVAGYPQRDLKEHFKIQAMLNRMLSERQKRRDQG